MIVILNENTYDDSMNQLLAVGFYHIITWSPLDKMVQHVKDTLSDINTRHGVDLMHLQLSNPPVLNLYGLTKIHKPGNKICRIMSKNSMLLAKILFDRENSKDRNRRRCFHEYEGDIRCPTG
jgi:hypothetical protein